MHPSLTENAWRQKVSKLLHSHVSMYCKTVARVQRRRPTNAGGQLTPSGRHHKPNSRPKPLYYSITKTATIDQNNASAPHRIGKRRCPLSEVHLRVISPLQWTAQKCISVESTRRPWTRSLLAGSAAARNPITRSKRQQQRQTQQ